MLEVVSKLFDSMCTFFLFEAFHRSFSVTIIHTINSRYVCELVRQQSFVPLARFATSKGRMFSLIVPAHTKTATYTIVNIVHYGHFHLRVSCD